MELVTRIPVYSCAWNGEVSPGYKSIPLDSVFDEIELNHQEAATIAAMPVGESIKFDDAKLTITRLPDRSFDNETDL